MISKASRDPSYVYLVAEGTIRLVSNDNPFGRPELRQALEKTQKSNKKSEKELPVTAPAAHSGGKKADRVANAAKVQVSN